MNSDLLYYLITFCVGVAGSLFAGFLVNRFKKLKPVNPYKWVRILVLISLTLCILSLVLITAIPAVRDLSRPIQGLLALIPGIFGGIASWLFLAYW